MYMYMYIWGQVLLSSGTGNFWVGQAHETKKNKLTSHCITRHNYVKHWTALMPSRCITMNHGGVGL